MFSLLLLNSCFRGTYSNSLEETFSPAAPKAIKKPAAEEKKSVAGELDGQAGVQLGITVKKEQANFGEWYQQVNEKKTHPLSLFPPWME